MFQPTLDHAYQLFDYYNQSLFDQQLPQTKIELSSQMISTAGMAMSASEPLIRLSETLLVQEEPFHNTLVHEMIHICQRFVVNVAERPHGPYFSAWMYAINKAYEHDKGVVRSPFGKLPCQGHADIKLNITVTHNYLGEQDAERQSLVGKIKKLLALSESPYENEAQAALLKAQQLMQSYEVSRDEIALTDEGSELESPIVRELFIRAKRVPAYWKRSLLTVLAKHYKCQYVEYSGQGIGVYGHRPYVEIVRHLLEYYSDVIEQIASTHRGKGTVYLNNFRSGMVDRLQLKLEEKQAEPCLADMASSPVQESDQDDKPALAHLHLEANELRDFIGIINPGFYRRRGSVSYVRMNQSAKKKGYESGKNLSVNDHLTPSQKKLNPSDRDCR